MIDNQGGNREGSCQRMRDILLNPANRLDGNFYRWTAMSFCTKNVLHLDIEESLHTLALANCDKTIW
jgi:hypothetical protein